MVRRRLTARKRVIVAPPRILHGATWASQPVIRAESNGLHAGYFPKTLKNLLSGLGYHDAPSYLGRRVPLRNFGYAWRVSVVTYKKPTANHTRVIRATYHTTTRRATFESGIRDAARLALARIRYEMDEELSSHQYTFFPMRFGGEPEVFVRRPCACEDERLKEQVQFSAELDEEMVGVLDELEEAHQRIARYEEVIDELNRTIAERNNGGGNDGGDDGDDAPEDDDEDPPEDDEEDEDEDGGDDGGDNPILEAHQDEEEEEEPFEREWEPEERLPSPTPEVPKKSKAQEEYEAIRKEIMEMKPEYYDFKQFKFVRPE